MVYTLSEETIQQLEELAEDHDLAAVGAGGAQRPVVGEDEPEGESKPEGEGEGEEGQREVAADGEEEMASVNDRAEHAARHHSLLDAVRLGQKSQLRLSSRLAK